MVKLCRITTMYPMNRRQVSEYCLTVGLVGTLHGPRPGKFDFQSLWPFSLIVRLILVSSLKDLVPNVPSFECLDLTGPISFNCYHFQLIFEHIFSFLIAFI